MHGRSSSGPRRPDVSFRPHEALDRPFQHERSHSLAGVVASREHLHGGRHRAGDDQWYRPAVLTDGKKPPRPASAQSPSECPQLPGAVGHTVAHRLSVVTPSGAARLKLSATRGVGHSHS